MPNCHPRRILVIRLPYLWPRYRVIDVEYMNANPNPCSLLTTSKVQAQSRQQSNIFTATRHCCNNLPSSTVMSLVDYASSDDDGAGSSASAGIPKFTSATRVVAAPDVSLEVE